MSRSPSVALVLLLLGYRILICEYDHITSRKSKPMKTSPLGRTGTQISPLCLGSRMFGQCGNSDHNQCVDIIHAALPRDLNPRPQHPKDDPSKTPEC